MNLIADLEHKDNPSESFNYQSRTYVIFVIIIIIIIDIGKLLNIVKSI